MVGASTLTDSEKSSSKDRMQEFDRITLTMSGERDSLNRWMHVKFLEPAIDTFISTGKRQSVKNMLVKTSAVIQALDFIEERRGKKQVEFGFFEEQLRRFLHMSGWAPAVKNFFTHPTTMQEYHEQFQAMRAEESTYKKGNYSEYVRVADASNGLQILIRHGLAATEGYYLDENGKLPPKLQHVADVQNHVMRAYLDVLKYKIDVAKDKPNIVRLRAEKYNISLAAAAEKILEEADFEYDTVMEREASDLPQIFLAVGEVCMKVRGLIGTLSAEVLISLYASTVRLKRALAS